MKARIIILGYLLILVSGVFSQPTISSFDVHYRQDTFAELSFTYNPNGKTIVEQGGYFRNYSSSPTAKTFCPSLQIQNIDTVVLSTLTPTNRYYAAPYIIWDNNGTNDTVFGSPEKSFYALATEPTSHVGFISISAATASSVTLSYSAATNANRYALFIVNGHTPIDASTIQDGINLLSAPNNTIGDQRAETTNTTYVWNSLTQNQTYTVSVIPINRFTIYTATTNYFTSGSVSTITFRLAPTSQATNISLVDYSTGIATISWTNGNGQERLVKMNTTNSFTDPAVGAYPTANPTWQNAGEQVVYIGNGNSVQLSGLSGNQTYWFRVYELNNPEANRAIYNTATESNNPVSVVTPIDPPATQDYDLVFSGITTNQITVSWTKGDGDGRIAVINTVNSFTNPVNNTTYTANSSYGGGEQVVYNGSGNSVTVTGLSSGTSYYFRVFAYNGSAGSEKYNIQTANQNPNVAGTAGVAPSQQDNSIVFSDITENSFKVSWTKGDGQYRLVAINIASSFTNPVNGTVYSANSVWQNAGQQWIYNGPDNEVVVTGLFPGTRYYVRIYAYNGLLNPTYKTSIATGNPKNTLTDGFIEWTGAVSTAWNNTSNWSHSIVPNGGNRVKIPQISGSNYPVVNQNTTCYQLVMQPLSQLTVATGVQLTVTTDLTINGNSSGSGSLVVQGNGTVSVGANTRFVRHTGSSNYWHFASVPTNNNDIKQFSGHYVNRWNETSQSWTQLNAQSTLDVMRGYSIKQFNRDTAVFTGTFNNQSVSLAVTNSGFGSYPGLNIVGNPYPSAIDWKAPSGWTRSNIEPTIYVYHTPSQTYYTYNYQTDVASPSSFDGVVPAGNGFYIIAETNTTIGTNNNVRVHSNQPYYKESTEKFPTLRIALSNKTFSDEMVIYFHPDAGKTMDYDGRFDAVKLYPESTQKPMIFAKGSGKFNEFAVKAFNTELLDRIPKGGWLDIPLRITMQEATEASVSAIICNMPDGISLDLLDPSKQIQIAFGKSEQPVFEGEYILRIGIQNQTPLGINESLTSIEINVYSQGNKLYIANNQEQGGHLLVSDILGRIVYSGTLFENETKVIDIEQNHTIFVISLRTPDGIKTIKFFKE